MSRVLGLARWERPVMLLAYGYPSGDGLAPFSAKRNIDDVEGVPIAMTIEIRGTQTQKKGDSSCWRPMPSTLPRASSGCRFPTQASRYDVRSRLDLYEDAARVRQSSA